VHVPGEADLNLYAYVHGRVFVAVDPVGCSSPDELYPIPHLPRSRRQPTPDIQTEDTSTPRLRYQRQSRHCRLALRGRRESERFNLNPTLEKNQPPNATPSSVGQFEDGYQLTTPSRPPGYRFEFTTRPRGAKPEKLHPG
jgi:hypothetical protein